jgi:glycosyltransferase involved in cell wall biosynthesis
LVNLTARRSAQIITVSKAGARDVIAHLDVDSTRIHSILNGIDQSKFHSISPAEKEDARQKYSLPSRYFLYIGGFDVRKNVFGVLDAYRHYLAQGGDPSIKLVVAGKLPEGRSNFFPDPQKRAAEINLTDQIHFCGWVQEEDKAALYALSTALIFPSLYEGFGLPVVEAQAAGAAVITSANAECRMSSTE